MGPAFHNLSARCRRNGETLMRRFLHGSGLVLICLILIHCHAAVPGGATDAGTTPQAAPFDNRINGTLQGQPMTPRSAVFVQRSYPASAIYPQGFTYLLVVMGNQDDVCAAFSAGNFRPNSTTLRMEVVAFGPLGAGDVGSAYALNRPRAAYSYAQYDASCRGSSARAQGALSLLDVSDTQVSGKFTLQAGSDSLSGTFVAVACPGLDEIDNPAGPGCK